MSEEKKGGANAPNPPSQRQPIREERGNVRNDNVGDSAFGERPIHFMVKPPPPPPTESGKKKE
jgi:hypothetical protein